MFTIGDMATHRVTFVIAETRFQAGSNLRKGSFQLTVERVVHPGREDLAASVGGSCLHSFQLRVRRVATQEPSLWDAAAHI